MIRFLIVMFLILCIPMQAQAMEYTAPTAPDEAEYYMPEDTESFSEGLWHVLSSALETMDPQLMDAIGICTRLIAITLLVTLVKNMHGVSGTAAELVGVLAAAATIFGTSDSLIRLGAETVTQISDYGKLLIPVMTAALAAQGGVTSSTALYAGTTMLDAVLGSLISAWIVPLLYLYLALSIAHSAVGENVLKKMADLVKWLATWILKIVLYVFTGYIGMTGVISGTTDAMAMKAAKLTISGAVPVVGGILSDASEAILVSAGIMKNAAGVYGLLAILAIFVAPFLKIGIHYMMLKLTAAITGVFGSKRMTELIGSISTAMGLLLGMTGAVCLMLMISTVCFMRGVG